MESQILRNTYREMRRRFADLNDPAHGWEHVKRVYKLALYIAQQEGADCFIVGMGTTFCTAVAYVVVRMKKMSSTRQTSIRAFMSRCVASGR